MVFINYEWVWWDRIKWDKLVDLITKIYLNKSGYDGRFLASYIFTDSLGRYLNNDNLRRQDVRLWTISHDENFDLRRMN